MYTTGHGGVSAIMAFDGARRLKRSTAIPTLMALNDVRGVVEWDMLRFMW